MARTRNCEISEICKIYSIYALFHRAWIHAIEIVVWISNYIRICNYSSTYNETGKVSPKTNKCMRFWWDFFTKSSLSSLSWQTTCLERPYTSMVVLYRFHCNYIQINWLDAIAHQSPNFNTVSLNHRCSKSMHEWVITSIRKYECNYS